MKNSFLLAIALFLCCLTANAKHIISGSMGYECLGNNTYEISVVIYRDCHGGGANFDDPAVFGVYQNETLLETTDVDITTFEEVMPFPYEDCPANFPAYCAEKATYVFTVTLPSNTDHYSVVYQRCCWAVSVLKNVLLFDIAGNLKRHEKIQHTTTAALPTANLQPGVYYIRVAEGNVVQIFDVIIMN